MTDMAEGLPPIGLLGSPLGSPVEPKRFEAILDPSNSAEDMLNLMASLMPQLGVQVSTGAMGIYRFDAPAIGSLAQGTYQSSTKVFNPASAFNTVVPVNGSIAIECAIVRRESGTSLSFTFSDDQWWSYERAEDWVANFLLNLAALNGRAAKLNGHRVELRLRQVEIRKNISALPCRILLDGCQAKSAVGLKSQNATNGRRGAISAPPGAFAKSFRHAIEAALLARDVVSSCR